MVGRCNATLCASLQVFQLSKSRPVSKSDLDLQILSHFPYFSLSLKPSNNSLKFSSSIIQIYPDHPLFLLPDTLQASSKFPSADPLIIRLFLQIPCTILIRAYNFSPKFSLFFPIFFSFSEQAGAHSDFQRSRCALRVQSPS